MTYAASSTKRCRPKAEREDVTEPDIGLGEEGGDEAEEGDFGALRKPVRLQVFLQYRVQLRLQTCAPSGREFYKR
jgi:hypothetical protein